MQYNLLGKTGLKVSRLSFGASSLGGVFHAVDEKDAIAAVHAALDAGINYFDVAPAYGGTKAETVLGKALKGIARNRYYLSTKIGKYTNPNMYGDDELDFSAARINASLKESAARLGTDYFDIIHLHDIEYKNRVHTEQALSEGLQTLYNLKKEGMIGAVSFGTYPLDLWQRIFNDYEIDAALVHNHFCLNDDSLLQLLPIASEKNIGIINASPFSSGLLTGGEAPGWHPATKEDREVFSRAAIFCRQHNTSIAKLALQFSVSLAAIPTTMFSSSNAQIVLRNVQWHEEDLDKELLREVQQILQPVMNKQWNF